MTLSQRKPELYRSAKKLEAEIARQGRAVAGKDSGGRAFLADECGVFFSCCVDRPMPLSFSRLNFPVIILRNE